MIKLSEIEAKYGDYLVDEDKLKELLVEPKPKTVYDRLLVGNVFLTEEDAKFAYERLWVIAELKKYAKEFSDEEWNDCTSSKYSIRYDCRDGRVSPSCCFLSKGAELYFENKQKVQEAIKAVGEERVKKYYLGVGK